MTKKEFREQLRDLASSTEPHSEKLRLPSHKDEVARVPTVPHNETSPTIPRKIGNPRNHMTSTTKGTSSKFDLGYLKLLVTNRIYAYLNKKGDPLKYLIEVQSEKVHKIQFSGLRINVVTWTQTRDKLRSSHFVIRSDDFAVTDIDYQLDELHQRTMNALEEVEK